MKNRAFTLIELLIVIAIIGILVAIVMSALNSARIKARDAIRKQDIKTIQTALQAYYMENGKYPVTNGYPSTIPNNSGWANSSESTWEILENELGVKLPRDPVNNTGGWAVDGYFNYTYGSITSANGLNGCPSGQAYQIVYRLEKGNATGDERGSGTVRCSDGVLYFRGGGAITEGVTPMM